MNSLTNQTKVGSTMRNLLKKTQEIEFITAYLHILIILPSYMFMYDLDQPILIKVWKVIKMFSKSSGI